MNVRFGKREMLPHVAYGQRFYTPVMHMASFVLPKATRKHLELICGPNGKPPKPIQLGVSLQSAAVAAGVALAVGAAAGAAAVYLTGRAGAAKGGSSAASSRSGGRS